MKRSGILCVLSLMALSAVAQVSPANNSGKQPRASSSGTTRADSVQLMMLYVMNDVPISRNYFNTLGDKIESMYILRGHNAIAAYGDKAKYGALIIALKPQYKEEILNVPAKDFR